MNLPVSLAFLPRGKVQGGEDLLVVEKGQIRDFWRNLGPSQAIVSDTRVGTGAGRCHCKDVFCDLQKLYWGRSVTTGRRETLQLSSRNANMSICRTTGQSGSISSMGESWGKSSWYMFLVTEERW